MQPLKIPCHPDKLDPSCHLCRVIMFDKRYQERFGVTGDMIPKGMPCGHNPQFSGCQVCTEVLNSEKHRARFGFPSIGKEGYWGDPEDMQTVAIPCGHPNHSSGCHFCELAQRDERYARLFSRTYVGPPKEEKEPTDPNAKKALHVIKQRCIHYTGKKLKESPSCGCGPLMECTKHGQCRTFNPGPEGAVTCLNCPDRKIRPEVYPNPKAGVVVGCFGLPNLVELQIKLIQKHNPGIPIFLTDDHSDGYYHTPDSNTNFGKLYDLTTKYNNVTLWSNPQRLGHASGDLCTYFLGLQWARALNLDALFKLSFRYIIDIPNWVQIWLDDWWKSGIATSSQACREGNSFFNIRSECMGMDVHKWHNKEILKHILPRVLSVEEGKWGISAEAVLWDDIRDRLDGTLHKCKFFGEDRFVKHPNQLWHCCNTRDEYQQIFDREGIEMDSEFRVTGWVHHPGYRG